MSSRSFTNIQRSTISSHSGCKKFSTDYFKPRVCFYKEFCTQLLVYSHLYVKAYKLTEGSMKNNFDSSRKKSLQMRYFNFLNVTNLDILLREQRRQKLDVNSLTVMKLQNCSSAMGTASVICEL